MNEADECRRLSVAMRRRDQVDVMKQTSVEMKKQYKKMDINKIEVRWRRWTHVAHASMLTGRSPA